MTARRSSLVLAAIAALLASMLAAPARAEDDDPSVVETSTDRAVSALEDVQAILEGERPDPSLLDEFGAPTETDQADATMALRDLALLKGELTGADRQQAETILARPAANQKVCQDRVCVHYRTGGVHEATPSYAATVLDTVLDVHDTYVAAGYRAPKSDRGIGGGNETDIYLRDVGAQGLYGYCTTDQALPSNGPFDAWAYCVLDNDYIEFPTNTPIENLQVTAAHEYFHAVQFGYDFAEDPWFMEATAAWVEDELYDNVDDNLQYLRQSPLRKPHIPLDTFGGTFHYGTWIFFRYLSERWGASQAGLPTIVRDMWRKADGSAGAPDKYSIQAVKAVLTSKKAPLEKTFAKFSNANRRPAQTYSEGRANRYQPSPLAKKYKLGKGAKRSASYRAAHLTSKTFKFTPAKSLKSLSFKLKLNLKMAPVGKGSAAVVSVKLKSGKVRVIPIKINRKGAGFKAVPFSARKVKYAELTLANAGTQYRCWTAGPYSCQGSSKNDNVKESFRAAVVR